MTGSSPGTRRHPPQLRRVFPFTNFSGRAGSARLAQPAAVGTIASMDDARETWTTIERPGYFGAKRDTIQAGYDAAHGVGRWRLAWFVGEVVVERAGMNMLYEDAYVAFMQRNADVVNQLAAEASDVFDDAITNLASGLSYEVQETANTHVQDVAIRRAMIRLGRRFNGPEPVQIRDSLGVHPLSLTLSPGQVPFHRPEFIVTPELEGWWLPGSVESFYQSNKVLQVLAV